MMEDSVLHNGNPNVHMDFEGPLEDQSNVLTKTGNFTIKGCVKHKSEDVV